MRKRLVALLTVTVLIVSVLAVGIIPAAALEECGDMNLSVEFIDYGNGAQDVAFSWNSYPGAYSYEVRFFPAAGGPPIIFDVPDGWQWAVAPLGVFELGAGYNVVIVPKGPAGNELCAANPTISGDITGSNGAFTYELPAGMVPYDAQASHPGPPVPLPDWINFPQKGTGSAPVCPADVKTVEGECPVSFEVACAACGGKAMVSKVDASFKPLFSPNLIGPVQLNMTIDTVDIEGTCTCKTGTTDA